MSSPLVVVVGRLSPSATGVRGEAFAAGRGYFHAVARAGATALVLPPIVETVPRVGDLLDRVDAVVLHGGGDVDPRRYGQEVAEQVSGVVPEHDDVELAVVTAALERDLPLLAICRGMQILDVALGGTLIQHLGNEDHWFRHHPVDLDADSHLSRAVGSTRVDACHSVHHQAIDRLGDGLRIVGRSADGVPEAIELPSHRWVVGTQWHPEDTAAHDPQQQSLFDALVAAC